MKRKNDATSSTSNDINEKLINLCRSKSTNTDPLNEISDLLSEGGDVNHVFRNGITSLMMASQDGHEEIVKLLLDIGAGVNQTTQSGNTALILASQNGHEETVKLLLDKGALVNQTTQNGSTALLRASHNGHKDTVTLLLNKEANVNQVGQNGNTALILASQNGHKDTVKFLLNKEANVNQVDQDGYTALILASQNGHKDTVKLLLDKEADVHQTTQNGNTALILASHSGHKGTVEFLLDKGAGANQNNQDGNTALILASHNGHKDTVTLLLDKGGDVNQVGQNGNTALILASHNGHKEIVTLLLKKGANAELSQCASQASKNPILIQHISEEEKCREQEGDIIAQRTDSTFQNVKKFLEQEFNDEGFLCPISLAIMKSPYSCLTHEESSRTLRGVAIVSEEIMQNYEKDTIIKHIATTVVAAPRDPLTNKEISTIFPNTYLKQEMIKYFSTEYPPVIQSLNNEGHYHSARKLAVDVLDKDFPITPEVRQQIVTELLPSIVDNISNKQISGEKRHREPSEDDENKSKEPKIVPSTNISPQESQRAANGSTLSQTQQGS